MRVLLVEDDATTSASIEMMLRKESFICDTTDLGEDGLEIGKLYEEPFTQLHIEGVDGVFTRDEQIDDLLDLIDTINEIAPAGD